MNKIFTLSLALITFFAIQLKGQITDPFFDHVSYRGAFGTTDWTQGWSNWNPQNTTYPSTTITVSGDITTNQTWAPNGSPLLGSAAFTNSNLLDPFFTPVTYIGAFGTTDWTSGWANWNPQTTNYATPTVTISGDITTNTTWSASNVYLLNGFVYVKSGATLTIPAGTVIRGDKTTKGTLIIERGGKINAQGTAMNPIIFTSNVAAGSRDYGDWGGVVICGTASINVPGGEALIEGGPTSYYGGGATPNDQDSSGVMKYVRIEFSGVPLQPNQELNGLTLGGVGSKTKLDYIQVSYCGDDSYEMFGGTVNAKHLIAFRGWDDDFDTDFGYRGKLQFLVSLRDPNIADQSGSNSFESDNDGSGSTNTPQTAPIFCNVSVFGPKATASTTINSNYKKSMHIRRNSKLSVYNSVFSGFPSGLYIDGSSTQNNAIANTLQIENTILAGMGNFFEIPSSSTVWTSAAAERAWFLTPAKNNDTLATNALMMVGNPFNLTAPDFLPSSSNTVYKLEGFVYVKAGATLTIAPGTIIRGDKTSKGTLIIERGGKLIAEGSLYNPIIFTSNVAAGSRDYGDWGGIIICGKAALNVPGGEAIIEGGPTSSYGGGANPDNNDNSGSLKYVRIEFPGIPLQPNQEINGLTMGAVGKGTTLDYIQVSYCGDDSYEWFGGNVNAKHLIAFRGWDDEFDTDYGYHGNLQYLVGLRDPNIADQSGSNGFESDNDGSGSTNTPQTKPIFSNLSMFGPKASSSSTFNSNFKSAMHIRRNSALNVYNSIFAGYPTGMLIDGSASQTNANNSELNVNNCVMSGMAKYFKIPSGGSVWTSEADARAWYLDSLRKNDTLVENTDLELMDPFNLNAPNFMPAATSDMLIGSIWYSNIGFETPSANLNNVKIYPNPTHGNLNVALTLNNSENVKIQLFDLSGRLIGNLLEQEMGAGAHTQTVSLPQLAGGFYLIKVSTSNDVSTFKLLKQ
jgi:hypothetical protein